jgi:predicted DNA-binding helix-hairpin-helix protein
VSYRRELRLYQADYLIRDYGFTHDELDYTIEGNLIAEVDPKKAWAERNLRQNPVEINQLPKEELRRIPGIGLKNAEKIIKLRRISKIRDISGLEKLGINTQRMRDFILVNGQRPSQQLSLF